jgi:hypothetical protein
LLIAPALYLPVEGLLDVPNGTIFVASNTGEAAGTLQDEVYHISTPTAAQLMTKHKYIPEDLMKSTRII